MDFRIDKLVNVIKEIERARTNLTAAQNHLRIIRQRLPDFTTGVTFGVYRTDDPNVVLIKTGSGVDGHKIQRLL